MCFSSGVLVHVVLATVFGPPSVDRTNSGGHACAGPLHQKYRPWTPAARDLYERGLIVAADTKLVPCWTVLRVCVPRTRRCSFATVADHLPRKRYRASHDLDLWHDLAKVLGHSGLERVRWEVWEGEPRS